MANALTNLPDIFADILLRGDGTRDDERVELLYNLYLAFSDVKI